MGLKQICDDCNIPLNDGDDVYCGSCYDNLQVDIDNLNVGLYKEKEKNKRLERDLMEMDAVNEGLESEVDNLKLELRKAMIVES